MLCWLAWLFAASVGPRVPENATMPDLTPIRYDVRLAIDYAAEQLHASAKLTVRNDGDSAVTHLPLLLYRLLRVQRASDGTAALGVEQGVVSYEDFPPLQANHAVVRLGRPLAPGDTMTIAIMYGGYLLGYAETGMRYVQDHIDTAFTILRDDALAFPRIGVPNIGALRRAPLPAYAYTVAITVPTGQVVANVGRLTTRVTDGATTTFTYENRAPAWRMDFAIARYGELERDGLRVFHFPADADGAARLMESAARAMHLYRDWFGPLDGDAGFVVIEIPDGWGSQADRTGIIQSAAAFREVNRTRELYHEISHLWNAPAADLPSPRWNEGLASFLEYLTADRLDGTAWLDREADRVLRRLRDRLQRDSALARIPLVDYGRTGHTDQSYSVGFMLFYLLHRTAGQAVFQTIVGGFYQRYAAEGGTTRELAALATEAGGAGMGRLFDDWVFTAGWADLVLAGAAVPDLVARYSRR